MNKSTFDGQTRQNTDTNPVFPVKAEDCPMFFGQIIDIFEDFLDNKGINLPNEDRNQAIADGEDEEGLAIIYGNDYDIIRAELTSMMQQWNIIPKEGE